MEIRRQTKIWDIFAEDFISPLLDYSNCPFSVT